MRKEEPVKQYSWHGSTWQIADEDLHRFPGAVPVEKPEEKKKTPANKGRKEVKNK